MTAGLLVAACTSIHTSSRSTTSAPGSPPATATSVAATSTSSPGVEPVPCKVAGLALSVEGTQGAAGTLEITFQLRNTTAAACTMTGYPTAQLYDSNGAAMMTQTVPGGTYTFTDFTPAAVSLAAGASAYTNIGYSDVPTGTTPCPPAASMWIMPPGDSTEHLVVTQNFVVCGAKLTVSPVFGSGSPQVQTTAPPHA